MKISLVTAKSICTGLFSLLVFSNARGEDEGVRRVIATPEQLRIEGVSARDGAIHIIEVTDDRADTNAASDSLAMAAAGHFSAAVPRFEGLRDRIYSSFVAQREEAGASLSRLGTNHFVEEFRAVSKSAQPFPVVASIKGLQVQMIEDALALGIKHAALNVDLSAWPDLAGRAESVVWKMDGETYHFRRSAVAGLDAQVKPFASHGVLVYLILLTYESADPAVNALLLHPLRASSMPNRLAAFNTVTHEGRSWFKALLEFIADRYSSTPSQTGGVVGYILGNEVNSHWFWANRGRATMESFAEDYLRAARLAHVAIRKASASARLYLSLEHHWNIRYPGGAADQTFAGRPFLDYFNRRAREQGNFDWAIAFHPYPENLFEPRFWRDRSATTNVDTPRITFKNLEMLPRYLRRPELRFEGQPRHIILSEQGFHSTDKPDGELNQAAAYSYAYYRSKQLGTIDAFILHRHVDHPAEGGLNLGLWRRNAAKSADPATFQKKQIYDVFLHADQPDWREHFDFALPVIGLDRWPE